MLKSPRPRGALFAVACLLLIVGVSTIALQAATAPPSVSRVTDLPFRIAAHVDQAKFKSALWGIQVVSLNTGAVLFEHNAAKFFVPASNTKLFTGALALDRLGPDFRIKTSLYSPAKPDRNGKLSSDVYLYGRGDPSFSARFESGGAIAAMDRLAANLAKTGLRQIRGDVVADESFFVGPSLGAGWTVDDFGTYYCPEVSALSFNDNAADIVVTPGSRQGQEASIQWLPPVPPMTFDNGIRTGSANSRTQLRWQRSPGQSHVSAWGSIPLGGTRVTNGLGAHDPASWFADVLMAQLTKHRIRVQGRIRKLDWIDQSKSTTRSTQWPELASVESPPMAEIVRQMMKPSQNLYAHLLLLQIGAQGEAATPLLTTADRGVAAMREWVKLFAAGQPSPYFEEGSGLSRRHQVSPSQIIALLRHMDRHAAKAAFVDSLPIAGVDGTLKTRMRGTPAENNIRAKTGTLDGVNALSGYVTTSAGERLAFSILLNSYTSTDPQRSARDEIDTLAILLAK